ncbi:MAG: hypothetical protein H6622_17220 [Halobacteriovoraceae bacterium]|nr:hypothetical protein [Halobacteriovoraceae bacterium]
MQNLEDNVIHIKYQTIFLQKRHLKELIKNSEKKILSHYLQVIEYRTREGFFKKGSFAVPKDKFTSINKNAFTKLHEIHYNIGTLKTSRGAHNQVLYKLPENYPKTMEEWKNVEGGYLQIDRAELLELIKELSDNELKVYLSLLLITKANENKADCNPEMGIETWYKVLRDDRFSMTQNTLKKCFKGLEDKGVISLAEPLSAKSRFLNRFIFSVKKISQKSVSKKMRTSFHKNDSEISQNPQNCVHLKENISKKEINLNQEQGLDSKPKKKQCRIDFDFYGLDTLDNPFDHKSLNTIKKHTNLSVEDIQFSVMRFSQYLNSGVWNTEIRDPVGYFCNRIREFGIYVPPVEFFEWERLERRKQENTDFSMEEMESIVSVSEESQKRAQEITDVHYIADVLSELKEHLGIRPRRESTFCAFQKEKKQDNARNERAIFSKGCVNV